jgi:hypothetical protein
VAERVSDHERGVPGRLELFVELADQLRQEDVELTEK